MIAWETIQAALQTWLGGASATNLGAAVFFGKQPGSVQPVMPYATLRITAVHRIGPFDEKSDSYDGTRPNGQEIEETTVGIREFMLEVHAYTAGTLGSISAAALLGQAVDSLQLLANQAAFEAAGCCCFDAGDVLDVSRLLETAFQGHATVELHFRTLSTITEYFGYIATVQLTDDITDEAGNPIPE